MIPSLDDRLDSVVRALQEVVLPALPPDRALAIEQAHLSLAQLGLIRSQLDEAPAFERREAEAMIGLARGLLDDARGGEATSKAAEALRSAVTAAALENPAEVRATTHNVGDAIEHLIDMSLKDGNDSFRASSMERVLASGRTAAMAERRWNQAAGFEAQALDVAADPV